MQLTCEEGKGGEGVRGSLEVREGGNAESEQEEEDDDDEESGRGREREGR